MWHRSNFRIPVHRKDASLLGIVGSSSEYSAVVDEYEY